MYLNEEWNDDEDDNPSAYQIPDEEVNDLLEDDIDAGEECIFCGGIIQKNGSCECR